MYPTGSIRGKMYQVRVYIYIYIYEEQTEITRMKGTCRKGSFFFRIDT